MKIKILIITLFLSVSNSFCESGLKVWVDTSNCINNIRQTYFHLGVMKVIILTEEFIKTGVKKTHKDDEIIKEITDQLFEYLRETKRNNAIKFIKARHNGYYAESIIWFSKGIEKAGEFIDNRMEWFKLSPKEAMDEVFDGSEQSIELYVEALEKCGSK